MKKFNVLIILIFSVFLATNVYALDLKFDDDIFGASGTFSYDGLGNGLVGSNINIDSVTGNDTPLNDGTKLLITGGSLNFTTGALISEVGGLYTFAGGGSFTLTGGIGALGIDDDSLILSGYFTDTPIVISSGSSAIFSSFGIDDKIEKLVAYYGLQDLPFEFANTTISLTGFTLNDDGSFMADVENADFNNTPVPEPATMLLLGVGLIGLAGVSRKKLFK